LTGVPSGNVFGFAGTAEEDAVGADAEAEVFVSCAKDVGARIEKIRIRLRHCFTITSPIESSSFLVLDGWKSTKTFRGNELSCEP
jgi:hypothetical protein